MPIDYSRIALDDDDAAARAQVHAHVDPFRSVPCALLSSAEIYDYALITGMLHPFYPEALKSASYEAHIGGQCVWWDQNGERHEETIIRGDRCILPANSIKFVQVEPKFRLPDYIAVRFNLRITHVHRGLLLGTGPLVDPGFPGKLLIPLHNLTSSDYDLNTREALIWIEFTKTTFGFKPTEAIASRKRHFVPFPPDKQGLTADQYLRKANGGYPIRSSIPAVIEEGRVASKRSAASAAAAATTATQIRNWVSGIAFVAFVALV